MLLHAQRASLVGSSTRISIVLRVFWAMLYSEQIILRVMLVNPIPDNWYCWSPREAVHFSAVDIKPLEAVTRNNGVKCHQYAKDTQLVYVFYLNRERQPRFYTGVCRQWRTGCAPANKSWILKTIVKRQRCHVFKVLTFRRWEGGLFCLLKSSFIYQQINICIVQNVA